MSGGDFIEALGWGSTFLLMWLLLLNKIPLEIDTGLALAFFFLTGVCATVGKAQINEKGKPKD